MLFTSWSNYRGRSSPSSSTEHHHSVHWSKDELEPDYGLVTVEADDYILINSDGLTNMIGPDEIRDIVLSDVSLEEKAQTLIRFANNAGGLDNITVVLLHFTEEDAA